MHIVLTGPMGAGKTTLGRLVAHNLDLPFAESDEWIAATTGRSAADLASADGVAALHALEAEHARSCLAARESRVIAIASSAIEDDGVYEALATPRVILLLAPPEVLMDRIRPGDHRRDLGPNRTETLRTLIDRRIERWTSIADAIVETLGPLEKAIDRVMTAATQ